MQEARNYYVLKVTSGQELNVALMMEERIKANNISEVYAILIPPELKGYVVVEASGAHVVRLITAGIRYFRGLAHGLLTREEVLSFVSKRTVQIGLKPGDVVEIASGPFRGFQAQVARVEEAKGEVVLNILESAYPLQVTVPADNVKQIKR
ncbi:transcription elongation factor Spt5 [Sulfodiicoccus acidiphilus]|uniref:Transcription elongation factor Spt5 n=1 Tax=Sulfodiicoccus acidiphilus TaxID=1670455 RepID=A0A348B305_9CREN|nr:transcription elongation factor Spt5 [Sulfodiicoccus acidiphilus]BBD72557.1 transcription elongation factor Spt5 [Sulfodiicoccus acidiphilus]GGT93677.1 transcription elongation factor Spt5 [Sulfodiicoccus acidiphilus]